MVLKPALMLQQISHKVNEIFHWSAQGKQFIVHWLNPINGPSPFAYGVADYLTDRVSNDALKLPLYIIC